MEVIDKVRKPLALAESNNPCGTARGAETIADRPRRNS
jgi:hypothetical protein